MSSASLPRLPNGLFQSNETWPTGLLLLSSWSLFILLAACNCYIYGRWISFESHTFSQSLTWATQHWWGWAVLSPMAIKHVKRHLQSRWTINFLKEISLQAITFSLLATLLTIMVKWLGNADSVELLKPLFNELYVGWLVYWVVYFAARQMLSMQTKSYVSIKSNHSTAGHVFKNDLTTNNLTTNDSTSKDSTIVRSLTNGSFTSELTVFKGSLKIVLPVQNIHFIKASGNYLEIFTAEDHYLLRQTMKALAISLDPEHFARIHRSSLVAIAKIKHISARSCGDFQIILDCQRTLTISKSFRAEAHRLSKIVNSLGEADKWQNQKT